MLFCPSPRGYIYATTEGGGSRPDFGYRHDPDAGAVAVVWVVRSLVGAPVDGSDPVLSFLACSRDPSGSINDLAVLGTPRTNP